MFWFFLILALGVLARLAGSDIGEKWGLAWLPEVVFCLPFGFSLGWALDSFGAQFHWSLIAAVLGGIVSYGGMQSATWLFLQWEGNEDPDTTRTSTLKPFIDWLAARFGYRLGDEGYSWVAASVKGAIIGAPIGGVFTAISWPLAHEIGSHLEPIFEKYNIDGRIPSDVLAGIGAGLSIMLFVSIINSL